MKRHKKEKIKKRKEKNFKDKSWIGWEEVSTPFDIKWSFKHRFLNNIQITKKVRRQAALDKAHFLKLMRGLKKKRSKRKNKKK